MNPRIPTVTAAVLLLATTLVACAGTPGASSTPTAAPSEVATPDAAAPVETDAPETPVDGSPTCETIVTDGTVAALTAAGWTAEEKDFVIGDVALPDGMLCLWADYSQASDHGQLYGWSAISAADAAEAQSALLASGWARENGADGSYFTEDADFALSVDDEGYGMTYLFGDGWVKLADTKQSLILVEWPR